MSEFQQVMAKQTDSLTSYRQGRKCPRVALALILLTCTILTLARASDHPPGEPVSSGEFKSITAPALQNVFRVTPALFSGSSPQSDAAFDALHQLGVKTIISVDGAPPLVDKARSRGMRYIHLPCGYGGVGRSRQVELVKAAQISPGPIYLHCHRGKHRGPAAAALIAMTSQKWTKRQALAWLEAAGTSAEYSGLYEAVSDFHPPTPKELANVDDSFPESAPAAGLVDLMVQLDKAWESLQPARSHLSNRGEIRAGVEAEKQLTMMRELFREAQRLPEAPQYHPGLLRCLEESEQAAEALNQLWRSQPDKPEAVSRAKIEASLTAMANACRSCHKKYRD